MQEVFSTLLKLMKDHSCVIIPDLGGFVLNARPAAIDNASNYFVPPSRELLFNAHLVHNDGLLAHAMMLEERISFEEATRRISAAVAMVKSSIESKGRADVGAYGSFVGTEGGYSFRFGEMSVEDASSFGLHEFYFPLLEAAPDEESVPRRDAPRAKSSSSRFWLGGVAAVASLLFLSQPLNDAGHIDTANFAQLPAREVVVLPQKSYYVVVDRFGTQEEAHAFGDSVAALLGDSAARFEVVRLEGEYLLASASSRSLGAACELRQGLAAGLRDSLMDRSFVLGVYR